MTDNKNPISGRTRDEEIQIARAIGGRLPSDVWAETRRHKKSRKKTARQKK